MRTARLPAHRPPPGFMPRWVPVLCVLLALWLQSWAGSYLAAAALTSTEICSAAGTTQRVDGNGQPLPDTTHHGHDCCLPVGWAPLPAGVWPPEGSGVHAMLRPDRSAARLGAEALTPSSRGPPAVS